MNRDIEEIKNKLRIEEVLSEYLKLKKAGSSFVALCPFHHEKTPSFYVSPERGIYKCFGCGESGDIFKFIQTFEGLTFPEVKQKLAEKAGVVLSDFKNKENFSEEKRKKERLKILLEESCSFFENNLKKDLKALNYLKKRGVREKTIQELRIGLALNEWNSLEKEMNKRGFQKEEMLEVGLIKEGKGGSFYDRFRNRIIFPIFNENNEVVAFSGRDLSGETKIAKYLNSPETLFFNKSEILYGLNFAKTEARKKDYFILVEGQMDLVLNYQVGFKNVVASSGTSLTEVHLGKMSNFSKKIIFAFDSDKAGIEASYKGIKKALKMDFEVKIIDMPKGSDPADIIKESEKEWIKKVSESKNVIEFFLNKIIFSELSLKEKIKEIENKIYPFLISLPTKMERNFYIKKIADYFSIENKDIESNLAILEKEIEVREKIELEKNEFDIFPKNNIILKAKDKILRHLSAIYFWQKELEEEKRIIEPEKILEVIEKYTDEEKFKKILSLPEKYKDFVSSLIFEAEVLYEEKEKGALLYDLEEMYSRLEKEFLEEKIIFLKKEIEFLIDDSQKKEKMIELQELIQKKNNL